MPKFLGMEPKTYLWVGGGLVALIVVYYVIKSRSGGQGAVAGGDTGLASGGITGSSPVSYAPGAPDTAGDAYQQQLNDLDVQAKTEALKEQKAMFDLQQQQGQQQLGFLGRQNELALQGAQQEQQFQLGYEKSAYETAQAAQDVVTRSVKGKKKVECPVGMHLVVDASGTPQCQAKGGGGFNLSTLFGGIGQIATGLFSGAAAAAPGIGSGAANAAAGYGLGQAGIPTGWQQQRPAQSPGQEPYFFTPPIAPRGGTYSGRPSQPTPYSPTTNKGMILL